MRQLAHPTAPPQPAPATAVAGLLGGRTFGPPSVVRRLRRPAAVGLMVGSVAVLSSASRRQRVTSRHLRPYGQPVVTLLSWNLAGRDLWSDVAASGADVALLQEARPPQPGLMPEAIPAPGSDWRTAGWPERHFRTAVARLTDDVALTGRPSVAVEEASQQSHWSVGRIGTVTAADVVRDGQVLFTALSVYAAWDRTPSGGLYADAAAHRVLSDLSALTFGTRHRLVVAGDWNILYGYGEHGDTLLA